MLKKINAWWSSVQHLKAEEVLNKREERFCYYQPWVHKLIMTNVSCINGDCQNQAKPLVQGHEVPAVSWWRQSKWNISLGLSSPPPHFSKTKQPKSQLMIACFCNSIKISSLEQEKLFFFFISDHMADNKYLRFLLLITSYRGMGRKSNVCSQVSWQIIPRHSSHVLTLSVISLGYKLFRARTLVVLWSQSILVLLQYMSE